MNNWLLIIVGVIFLVCIVVGCVKGVFKIGISLLSTVLTIVLVIYLAPFVGNALTRFTPVDEMIEEKCIEAFVPTISAELFAGKDLTGTPLEGIEVERLNHFTELDMERYGVTASDILNILGEISKEQQIRGIEVSGMPHFLKEILLENNNPAIYEELGVSTFAEYVATYVSRMIIRLISFLVTFIFAIIIVKALVVAVDILGELPGVGFTNRFFGGVLGALLALVIVWILFLGVTLLYTTEAGKSTFAMIEQSRLLTFIYEKNILLTKLISF